MSNDPYRPFASQPATPASATQPATPASSVSGEQTYAPAPSTSVGSVQYQQAVQSRPASYVGAEQGLLVTTTDRVDGKRISNYLGVVAGEVVLGTSISKDIKGSVRGFVGGRSSSYEKEVRYARQQATLEMVQVAQQLGATAIVGVSYSYVTVNALVMVAATGTAVILEDL